MKQIGDKVIKLSLMVIAFSAIGSLILIALFIFKEGVPFMVRLGLGDFLASSDWQPEKGHYGIFPMLIASLWVTFGAMLIGAPLGIAGAVFLSEFVPKSVMRVIKVMPANRRIFISFI